MMNEQTKILTDIDAGKDVKITDILGGHMLIERLSALGIRKGKRIKKISAHFWKGPITVQVDKTKIAIGHAMAEKIEVIEVEE